MVQTPELRVPPIDIPLIIFYPDVDLAREGKKNMETFLKSSLQRVGVGQCANHDIGQCPPTSVQGPHLSPGPLLPSAGTEQGLSTAK